MAASLPIEIIEKILSYCDGETLFSASTSCLVLRKLITDNPCKDISKAWRTACNESIPFDFCIDILENLFPKYFLKESSVDWKLLYLSWMKWINIHNWIKYENVESFPTIDINFSVLSTAKSGKWLIAAVPVKQNLLAVDLETLKLHIIFHGRYIKCFRLVCDLFPEIVDTSNSWLPGIKHDKAVLTLDCNVDAILDLHSGHVQYLNNIGRTEDIRYFENYRIHIKRKEPPLGFLILSFDFVNLSKVRVQEFDDSCEAYLLDIWRDKVLIQLNGAQILENYSIDGSSSESIGISSGNTSRNFTFYRYCELSIKIDSIDEDDHTLLIQVGPKSKIFYPFDDINSIITCAVFRAGILLIGSEQGEVYGYQVKKLSDLLKLELDDHLWKFELRETSDGLRCCITNLEIEFGLAPALWISTRKVIYKVPLMKSCV